jgi:zinc protease
MARLLGQGSELPNGMALYVVESHNLPIVAANMVFRSGSAADPADMPGLAGFTAAMLDEGTSKRDALQIANEVYALGATLNTGTQTDGSNASVRALKQNASAAMSILSDVVLNPAFPDKEVERIRNDRLTALMQQRDQPWPTALRVMNACLFGPSHPYGHTQLGTQDAIKKITRDDLMKLYSSTFSPKNAALIVVGDVTRPRPRSSPRTPLVRKATPLRPAPPAGTMVTSRAVIVDKPGNNQTMLLAGQMGVKRPIRTTKSEMNTVPGGLFSSRSTDLREDKG